MKDGGGHIVVLGAAISEFFDGGKNQAEQFAGLDAAGRRAQIGQALDAEAIAAVILRFGDAVGAKKNGVAGRDLQGIGFVGGAGEKTGRESGEFEGAAGLR